MTTSGSGGQQKSNMAVLNYKNMTCQEVLNACSSSSDEEDAKYQHMANERLKQSSAAAVEEAKGPNHETPDGGNDEYDHCMRNIKNPAVRDKYIDSHLLKDSSDEDEEENPQDRFTGHNSSNLQFSTRPGLLSQNVSNSTASTK